MTVIIGNGCQLTRTRGFNRRIKMSWTEIGAIGEPIGAIGLFISSWHMK